MRVRNFDVPGDDRHRVGYPRCLRREQLGHRPVRNRDRSVVPADQGIAALVVIQHVHPTQADARIGDHHVEEPSEPRRDPLGRLGVEQVGRGDQRTAQSGRTPFGVHRLDEAHVEVELRRRRPRRQALDRDPGQLERRTLGVLQGQGYLEQRMPRQGACRRQLLDQALERHVLMCQSGQARLPDPGHRLGETRIPRHIGPHDQGVDEEPHQVVERLVGPTRGAGPDRDVGTCTEVGQQHRERRLEHHEHGRLLGPRQLRQPPVHLGGDPQRHSHRLVAGRRRARPVGG